MLATPQDLTDLLARLGNGDRDAFARLYQATSLKLFGIIFRILRQREISEEIMQEVYVRIWEHAAEFQPGRASPITWMASIARNRAIDEVRRRRPVTLPDGVEAHEVADGSALASELLEANDELKRLEACLDQLDDQRRAVVKLGYLDGLSRQELADRFDQPVGTIKSWLHRSLKQLKDCLGS